MKRPDINEITNSMKSRIPSNAEDALDAIEIRWHQMEELITYIEHLESDRDKLKTMVGGGTKLCEKCLRVKCQCGVGK